MELQLNINIDERNSVKAFLEELRYQLTTLSDTKKSKLESKELTFDQKMTALMEWREES